MALKAEEHLKQECSKDQANIQKEEEEEKQFDKPYLNHHHYDDEGIPHSIECSIVMEDDERRNVEQTRATEATLQSTPSHAHTSDSTSTHNDNVKQLAASNSSLSWVSVISLSEN